MIIKIENAPTGESLECTCRLFPPSLHPSILPVVVAEIRVQRVQIKSRSRSAAHQLRDHLSPRNQRTIRGFNLARLRSVKSESYRSFDSTNSARLATRHRNTRSGPKFAIFFLPPPRCGEVRGPSGVRDLRVSPTRRGERRVATRAPLCL